MDKNIKNEIAVYILNNNKQILLQKHSDNKKYNPNMWSILKGHVEENEGIIDAAIREIHEELGLNVNIKDIHPLNNHQFTRRENNCNTFFFLIRCNLKEDDFIIKENELSAVKWVDIREIINNIKNNDTNIALDKTQLIHLDYLRLL